MKVTERSFVLYGACGVLAVLVAWGFALSGSPSKNRALMEDRRQQDSLRCIACYAQQYACKFEKFPENQQDLEKYLHENDVNNRWCNEGDLRCNYNYRSGDYSLNMADVSRYQASGNDSFTLCTSFRYAASDQTLYQPESVLPTEMKGYKSGDQCFTFKPRICLRHK